MSTNEAGYGQSTKAANAAAITFADLLERARVRHRSRIGTTTPMSTETTTSSTPSTTTTSMPYWRRNIGSDGGFVQPKITGGRMRHSYFKRGQQEQEDRQPEAPAGSNLKETPRTRQSFPRSRSRVPYRTLRVQQRLIRRPSLARSPTTTIATTTTTTTTTTTQAPTTTSAVFTNVQTASAMMVTRNVTSTRIVTANPGSESQFLRQATRGTTTMRPYWQSSMHSTKRTTLAPWQRRPMHSTMLPTPPTPPSLPPWLRPRPSAAPLIAPPTAKLWPPRDKMATNKPIAQNHPPWLLTTTPPTIMTTTTTSTTTTTTSTTSTTTAKTTSETEYPDYEATEVPFDWSAPDSAPATEEQPNPPPFLQPPVQRIPRIIPDSPKDDYSVDEQEEKPHLIDADEKGTEILSGQYHEINPGQYHEVNPGQYHEVNPGQYHEVNPGQYHEVTPGQDTTMPPLEEKPEDLEVEVEVERAGNRRVYNVQSRVGDEDGGGEFIIGEIGTLNEENGQTLQGVRYTAVADPNSNVDEQFILETFHKYFSFS